MLCGKERNGRPGSRQRGGYLYEYIKDQSTEEILRQRRHAGEGPGRGGPVCGAGRVCSHRGHVRKREIHPSAHAGRPGPAHLGEGVGGRQGHFKAEGRGTHHLPAQEDRVRVPELQPGSSAERVREHRAAGGAGRQQAGQEICGGHH